MASREHVEQQERALLQAAEDLLRSHGYTIVTADPQLFPRRRPSLAALKDGRLLVGIVATFPQPGAFCNPDQQQRLREELDILIEENRPDRDPRVSYVQAVAFVQTPNDVRAALPPDDVKWVVVQTPSELPAEFDRLVVPLGVPGAD